MKDNIFLKLKAKLPDVQENILLKDYTTFKIGGPAEYFLLAKTKEEILNAIKVAKDLKIPIFIMGGGSNLLVLDNGVKGLVVKNQESIPIALRPNNVVEAPAGAVLEKVVDFSIENYLKGLEWSGGLPGTFGGAIRGNAGAFGGEIKDSIFEVQALDNKFNLRKLSNHECQFSYRSSIFKEKNWVVLAGSVRLQEGNKEELRKIADSRINYRNEKHPLEYPNAGSVFKNVNLELVPIEVQPLFLDKVKKDPFPIVPAAWFIIGTGLVGKKIGQAQISEKHSNYIVNLERAKASDVLELIDLIKKEVKMAYGINLETEIQTVGF